MPAPHHTSPIKPLLDAFIGLVAAISRRITPPDRLLRKFYNPDRRENDFIETVIPYDQTLKIRINTSSFFEWEIFFKGYYEKYLVRLFKRHVFPGAVCIDIGANIGSNTLIMANLAGPSGAVYAFEPNPDFFSKLDQNVRLNEIHNVRLFMKAIDPVAGTAELFVGSGPVKTASLVHFSESYDKRVNIETITPGEALRDLKACDFIKIDVDGTEGRVIESCRDIILRHQPLVLFEYSAEAWREAGWTFARTADFFRQNRYQLYEVRIKGEPVVLDELPDFTNIFCVPQTKDIRKQPIELKC